ncbi:polysaccharide lyase 8 family protein [Paenibacillus sp. GCM10023252]|uniref:polysaccharide lyase 8 family protein n=1 Tax=Paenibacillus sp. GCM10023252 TaxID=3252649 RepID=UPI00361C84E4
MAKREEIRASQVSTKQVPVSKRWLCGVLGAALVTTLVGGVSMETASAAAPHDAIREKWRNTLTGGLSLNTSDPDIASQIETLDVSVSTCTSAPCSTGTGYWDKMDTTPSGYLWQDLASSTNTAIIRQNYDRLKAMALAYTTEGSRFQGHTALKSHIITGLEWLYANRYYIRPAFGNWWDLEIGIPLRLQDIITLLYTDLTAEQRTNYLNVVGHFTPNCNTYLDNYTATGANRVWKCTVLAQHGILASDDDKLLRAKNGLSDTDTGNGSKSVFQYTTSGDGFYAADGGFIQHGKHPYNGGYGISFLSDLSKLLYLLHGSTWQVTDPNVNNLYEWIGDSYEPLIYKGAFLDMFRGREIARSASQDHMAGHRAVSAIIRLSQIAPSSYAAEYKRMVKYWIQSDTYSSYYSDSSVEMITRAKAIMQDSSVTPRGELVKHKRMPSIDRVVHLRPGFGFGVSMHSSRIYNYESINQENKHGWYTGEGMTYLYNSDLAQYSGDYWATVDPYRLPGTTVDTMAKSDSANQSTASSSSWAGGVTSNDGLYGVSGMELDALDSALTAKKSWFMLDDEIVALGAGITNTTDNRTIVTTVDNRKLTPAGNQEVRVNSTTNVRPTTMSLVERFDNTNWIHLAGNTAGADIGYYFPQPERVYGKREVRAGSWLDINAGDTKTATVSNPYMSFVISHDSAPNNDDYAYVLLPGKSASQVAAYAGAPNITVTANDAGAQAVRHDAAGLKLTAANFWTDAVRTASGITSNKKASIIVKETASAYEISVSDPTQLNTGTISVQVAGTVTGVASKDASITASSGSAISFTVAVSGSKGKSHRIVYNK